MYKQRRARNRKILFHHEYLIMNILYLIISAHEFPYLQLRRIAESTWQSRLGEKDRIINLYSQRSLGRSELDRNAFLGKDGAFLTGNRRIEKPCLINEISWTFPTFDGWDSILHKTISAFEYALNNSNFDFIVRTAPSSFWNPTSLRSRLSSAQSDCAVGTIRDHNGIKYIEGSNLIMHREVIEKIVNRIDLLDFKLIDDVAIGDVLKKLSIKMIDWPRPRIERRWDFHDTRYGEFSEIYSFRCRQSKPYDWKVLQRELSNMVKIHNILIQTKKY